MKNNLRNLLVLCVCMAISMGVIFADDLTDADKEAAVYQLYAAYEHEFPGVKGISAQTAMALLHQGQVVFVDVRKPAEKEISTLPGAVGEQDYQINADRFKGRTVVAYCTIGYRSGAFAEKMAEKGAEVFNLEGGILAWMWAGGVLHDATGRPVKKAHVYAEKWDLAPAAYETTRFGFWQRLF